MVIIHRFFSKYSSVFTHMFVVVSLAGCLQFSDPGRDSDNNLPPKSMGKKYDLVPGTMNLESKKEIDLSSYFDKDFDRIILSDERGSVSNISKRSALRSKNIWFSAGGITTVRLMKSGVVVFKERLR